MSTTSSASTGTLESSDPLATIAEQHTGPRAAPAPIPLSRVVRVELRKMFDTRSGFWLMAGIAILAIGATAAVIVFAPDSALTYDTFATAIGVPMAVILPIVAILAVTSEWSQRTGLTTFTLVPDRGRVIAVKAGLAIAIGVVSMLLAAAIGALGNVVGTAIAGTDTVWDISAANLGMIMVANVLGLLVGFMLGTLLRSSAAAIVAYFVYSFVLPGATSALAAAQEWYRDLGPWIDFNYATTPLFDGVPSAEQWAQLATSGTIWLLVPLAIGLRLILRAEVK
ncbi:ABC transporter permease [Nocardioides ochotonae]|uniref:ABC transporter permease n=1 Tax=Nocardioides ochotonae TaxID=2685869 RepID=UPI001CD71D11|nr:ABC transporter permease [Nocardioides ochotonae]